MTDYTSLGAGPKTKELVDAAMDSLRDKGCTHSLIKMTASVGTVPQLAPDMTVYQRLEAWCPKCEIGGKAVCDLETLVLT